jgi:hypothetical protein
VIAALRRARRAAVWSAVLWGAFPAAASAQVSLGSSAPRRGSWEISGGVVWSGGYDMGTRAAELTRNIGTGTAAFDLFTTTSKVTPAIGGQGRLGFYVSRALALEAGVQYLQPTFSSRLANDTEGAPGVTATETMSRYVVDGSLVFHLRGLAFARGRGVPFVSGGAGYLRELHEGNGLIETGSEYHAGAGLKFWFGPGRRRLGVRADVGLMVRNGVFDFKDARRTVPTAGLSLAYLF